MQITVIVPDDKATDREMLDLVALSNGSSGRQGQPITTWSSEQVRGLRCPVAIHPDRLGPVRDKNWLSNLMKEEPRLPAALAAVLQGVEDGMVPVAAYDLLFVMAAGWEVVLFSGGGSNVVPDVWPEIESLWIRCGFRENRDYWRMIQSALFDLRWQDRLSGSIPRLTADLPVSDILASLLPLDVLLQGLALAQRNGKPMQSLGPLLPPLTQGGQEPPSFWFDCVDVQAPTDRRPLFVPFSAESESHLARFETAACLGCRLEHEALRRVLNRTGALFRAESQPSEVLDGSLLVGGALRRVWELVHVPGTSGGDPTQRQAQLTATEQEILSLAEAAHREYVFLAEYLPRAQALVERVREFRAFRSRFNHSLLRNDFLCRLGLTSDVLPSADLGDDARGRKAVDELTERWGDLTELTPTMKDGLAAWPEVERQGLVLLEKAGALCVAGSGPKGVGLDVARHALLSIRNGVGRLAEWPYLDSDTRKSVAREFWQGAVVFHRAVHDLAGLGSPAPLPLERSIK